jgi:hypothetical protein
VVSVKQTLEQIDEIVKSGKLLMSGDNETMVAIVKAAILNNLTVSIYLTHHQAEEIKAWYWTPERVERSGLNPISPEEISKISGLGVKNIDNFRYSSFECECGHVYGAFDFFQQGINEHGLEAVNAVFASKNFTLFQVNPTFVRICPSCGRALRRLCGGDYDCDKYGGCCCSPAMSRPKPT